MKKAAAKKVVTKKRLRWIKWNAGEATECPVHEDSTVMIKRKDGHKSQFPIVARYLWWCDVGPGSITHYYVVKKAPKVAPVEEKPTPPALDYKYDLGPVSQFTPKLEPVDLGIQPFHVILVGILGLILGLCLR